ncbi:MAG: hypothetical protein D6707_02370 [Bacteroidetes bacterium]|nr:MAG: hypothetical protein D6707_02370 [Bacteroidota bacterium]
MSSAFDNIKKQRGSLRKDVGVVSINDLKDKLFNNEPLSEEEKRAIVNYDHYRFVKLNKIDDEMEFHDMYLKLQAMANLWDYREFLKDEYSL